MPCDKSQQPVRETTALLAMSNAKRVDLHTSDLTCVQTGTTYEMMGYMRDRPGEWFLAHAHWHNGQHSWPGAVSYDGPTGQLRMAPVATK